MLKYILIACVAALAILIAIGATSYQYLKPKVTIPTELSPEDLHDVLDKIRSDNNLPSLSAAVIDQNGIRHAAYTGVRKTGDSTQVTPQDLYHIGSCTKAMTAVLTAMYIDEGHLDWASTLIDIFPEMDTIIHESYKASTVYDLLTHTAGITPNTPEFHNYKDLPIQERRYKIINQALRDPDDHQRGDYVYSNLGYTIVGTMLERLTSQSWEELMQERIFSPLNMTTAGFGVPSSIDQVDQPWGHYKPLGFGDWTSIQQDNPASMGPAGTVHCTLEDWGKFISFQLLDNDTTLLSKPQRQKLLEVHKDDYAPGWVVVNRSWAKGKAYTHAGSNTMNYALAWVAPNLERAYIVCTNSSSANSHQICDGVIGALIKVDMNDN